MAVGHHIIIHFLHFLPIAPSSSPHSHLPPVYAESTSDVKVFYFYWMRAACNAFTSVPANS